MNNTTHRIAETQRVLTRNESSFISNDGSLLSHQSDTVISGFPKDNTDAIVYRTDTGQINEDTPINATPLSTIMKTKIKQVLDSKTNFTSSESINTARVNGGQEPNYPLAQQSPPSYLKRFEFSHEGNTILFDEDTAYVKNLTKSPVSTIRSPSFSLVESSLSRGFQSQSTNHLKIQLRMTDHEFPALKKRNLSPQITEQPTHRRKIDNSDAHQVLESNLGEYNDSTSSPTLTTASDDNSSAKPTTNFTTNNMSTISLMNVLNGDNLIESSMPSFSEADPNTLSTNPSQDSSVFSTTYIDNTALPRNISSAPSPALSLPSPSASPFTVGPRDSVRIPSPEAVEGESDHELENTEDKTLVQFIQNRDESPTAETGFSDAHIRKTDNSDSGNEKNLFENTFPLDSISNLIEGFNDLPTPLKNYVMYQLLKRCDRNSLSIVANVIVPALRLDILSLVPVEIASQILSYLDPISLCDAAIVSKSWNTIVDGQKKTWKERLFENFDDVTEEEILTARIQKWSYTNWSKTPATISISNLTKEQVDTKINIYKAIYRRRLLIHRIWMDPEKKPKSIICPSTSRKVITCLQFDDDKIVTGCEDHWISVYDTKTGGLKCLLQGHDGGVWALQFVGNILVSGSTDRTVRVWDIEKAKCTHVFTGHTSTVRCLDIIMPNKVLNKNNRLPDQRVTKFPPEPLIVTGSRDSTLRVWRLPRESDLEYHSGSSTVTTVPSPFSSSPDPFFQQLLRGHSQSVRSISGYSDTVVSGSYDTTVRVWDLKSGKCRHMLAGHGQRVYSAVIDHKRNRCISGSMDWYVKVWCLEKGSCLYTLEGHTSLVGLLNLNGTTLVSAAADSTLRVWNPEDGTFIHKLEGHAGAVACFQHDDHKLVSGSESTIKLWDIKTGKHVKDLVSGCEATWQVRYNTRRCVAAVKLNGEARVIVLEFDNEEDIGQSTKKDATDSRAELLENTSVSERNVDEQPLFDEDEV